MVRLTKIYTRGGDGGETSLVDGARVRKDADRIAAFGAVDEANAVIGLARLAVDAALAAALGRIQNDLFDLGADLATPPLSGDAEAGALRMTDGQVARLEAEIDAMNARLAPLESFILPGGSEGAARLHVARTVVRRAERLMVRAAQSETIGAPALRYINRLSDHLFVAARIANDEGRSDVLWQPGATREIGA
ncbi:MAG: cob(I)yrinic acid a,c-diamide adenosyltransferase [Rhodothalassiaceae bacterium]